MTRPKQPYRMVDGPVFRVRKRTDGRWEIAGTTLRFQTLGLAATCAKDKARAERGIATWEYPDGTPMGRVDARRRRLA